MSNANLKSHALYWAMLAGVAVVQIGLLVKIIFDRQTLLTTGREIVMQVQPVDPRDWLRGDYVILGYGISPVSMTAEQNGAPLDSITPGRTVYATLHAGADGVWTVKRLTPAYPAGIEPQDVAVKGIVQQRWRGRQSGDNQFTIKYGIESYFVPEGTGRQLESSVRDKKIQAIIAVGAGGEVAIKGLIIDGERREATSVF
ncbi:MAG: GDYXXLXY domain-containing protein [Hyphomicrobium sp.]|nr:GDYXXLXY domain-containing protein [Hyphomicrobium sp.]